MAEDSHHNQRDPKNLDIYTGRITAGSLPWEVTGHTAEGREKKTEMALNSKFAWTALTLQLFFILIFAFFVKYGPDVEASNPKNDNSFQNITSYSNIVKDYPVFQDINSMIFIGIGLLYAFLRRYGYTGMGMNFFLCGICVQWGIITQGWLKMKDRKIEIDVISLMKGEFAAASGVIALGGIFGKVGLLQMIAFVMLEVLAYSGVNHCRQVYLQVSDVGESVALHLFAAVFGCSAAYVVDKKANVKGNPNEATSYNSNIFSLLGTVLLWVFWPSFNAAGDDGDSQYRSIINTFFALIGSGMTCFAMSALLHKNNKFTLSHIQNGALAGAVGVGAIADLMIQPFGSLAVGAVSGCLCVAGFKYFAPFLTKLSIYDPCGINSLHGLPGLFSGILGIIAILFANEEIYNYSVYKHYPAMAPMANTTALVELQNKTDIIIEPGLGRTTESQAVYQFIYIIVVIVASCLTGLITGAILRLKILNPLEDKQMYVDDIMWDLTTVDTSETKQTSEEKSNVTVISEKL